MGVDVEMSGSGEIGPVSGWSVTEQATPVAPGDTRGSVGSASVTAAARETSIFAKANPVSVETDAGVFRGRVGSVATAGLAVTLGIVGGLGFLVVDRTMPPIWFDDVADQTFLEYGSNAGQGSAPNGMAIDPADGSVYVTNSGTVNGVDRHKVIKFDADGNYLLEFGSFGTGNGQFGGATNIAVSPVDGSVYVSDILNSRIQKFTSSGAYVTKWGTTGSGNGQFGAVGPYGLAVDSTGAVYAADRSNARIQKFTSSGTYSAQVAVPGFDTNNNIVSLKIGPGDVLYAALLLTTTADSPGRIRSYDASLSPLGDIRPAVVPGSLGGIVSIDVDASGIWAYWGGTTYLVKYDFTGNEVDRWVSSYPAPTNLSTTYGIAVSPAGTVYVLLKPTYINGQFASFGGNSIVAFNFQPVSLSQAIQRYMEAVDPTLNGYTLDYQAASDPDVLFPGWRGNVWAKLKELCTMYGLEIALEDDVIVIRDIAAEMIEIPNHTPVTVEPGPGPFSGQFVELTYQNPVAGAQVMWDAADVGQVYSIDVGESRVVTVTTSSHPTELGASVLTEALPIQPGQYHVVDSLGVTVTAAAWTGSVVATVGDAPGVINLNLRGPTAAMSGYTGPFFFATSRGESTGSTPAISIMGNGLTTSRVTKRLRTGADPLDTTQDVAVSVDSPFLDTLERAYDRGIWTSVLAGTGTVTARFDIPASSLPGFGVTCGKRFRYGDAIYRIRSVVWGPVRASVEAEWYVTAGDFDESWAGQTVGDFDALWAGYSTGDVNLMPLRT